MLTLLFLLLAASAPGQSRSGTGPVSAWLPQEAISMPEIRRRVAPEGVAITQRTVVEMEVVVNQTGRVAHARVVTSGSEEIDRAALAVLRDWEFRPGMNATRPMPLLVLLRMVIDPPGRPGSRSEVSGTIRRLPAFKAEATNLFASAVQLDAMRPPPPKYVLPRAVRSVNPSYTRNAMREKIQGSVELQAVILEDGSVGAVRVVKSLDDRHGLDQQAIAAAGRWFFEPAMVDGRPTPVTVTLVLEFQLR